MAIDLNNLGRMSRGKKIDPREIFMALPSKNEKYDYPRDVQSEVWKKWFEKRNNRDNIIKMNTGSGKTVVALMILKSCLNEGKGPAIYVVPDSYLMQQVKEQADLLGIETTTNEAGLNFKRGKSILIINIHTLVNGKSKYGMRSEDNVEFESIVIDDIHACMSVIQNQFMITLNGESVGYEKIVNIFLNDLKAQSESKIMNILDSDMSYDNMLVPFWAWQEKCSEVLKILLEERKNDSNINFSVDLVKDSLKHCRCYVNRRKIEIIPNSIPIHVIKSLENASRRIYLSATLPDDSIFSTVMDVDLKKIEENITPERANDIGERLIVVPKLVCEDITAEHIRGEIIKLAEEVNVVVLSPSRKSAAIWEECGGKLIDSKNMSEGIEEIKSHSKGLYVILNKYDGIDLPNDACRVLVIDGLPKVVNMNDRYEKEVANQSNRILQQRIQKIEQGMGRGVRSNSDYCIVFLLGNELTDVIYSHNACELFSDATKKQYILSQEICEGAEGIDEIMELVHRILMRDEGWVALNKDIVSSVLYSKEIKYDEAVVAVRKAFNLAEIGSYNEAIEVLCNSSNGIKDEQVKGYYEQQRAEYLNMVDKKAAQQLLISAKKKNKYLLNPIEGVQSSKAIKKFSDQAKEMLQFQEEMKLINDRNKYILFVDEYLDKLVFEENTHDEFEEAIKIVLQLLGFVANRPEKETGKGPDDFCFVSESRSLIIECKNEVKTDTICKHDCNQLEGSFNWFNNVYPMRRGIPILIHKSNVFEYDCSPRKEIRILTMEMLEKLKDSIKKFSVAYAREENYANGSCIKTLLETYKLTGNVFVEQYTVDYKVKSR